MARLKERFEKEDIIKLQKELNISNPMRVPRLKYIVLNGCSSEALQNNRVLESMSEELGVITGQKPVITKARKSISNFKLRKGQSIGVKVTLRKYRMYEFFDRLVNVALPRVRDFRGVSPKSFDGRGNYTLGIKEQIIFPEISYEKVDKIRGFNISIATSAQNDDEGRALLRCLGMPFRSA